MKKIKYFLLLLCITVICAGCSPKSPAAVKPTLYAPFVGGSSSSGSDDPVGDSDPVTPAAPSNNYIKLTIAADGSVIYVNVNKISGIKDNAPDGTAIYSEGSFTYKVKESLPEVMELLKNKK